MTPFMLNWLTRRAMSAPRVKDNIEIPTVYQRVEYLESTGNQWINTGFAPNQDNVRAIIDYECNAKGDNIFFGMAQYDGNDFALNNYFINRKFCWWGGGNFILTLDSEETRTLFEIGSVVKHNGEIVGTLSLSKTFVGNTNRITLFGLANAANPSDTLYRATGKIRNFALYYGDELKMNLIPCYRKSDGKPGMWDMVSWKFFTNAGSGADFTVGPDVVQPATKYIVFEDRAVEAICVQNFSSDGIGLTLQDAAAVTSIYQSVFINNTQITSFDELQYFTGLRNGLVGYGFYGCSNLTSLVFPNTIEYIPAHLCNNSGLVGDLVIPASVNNISGAAFWNTHLTSCTVLATTPPTLEMSFLPSSVTAIYVPAGSVAAYKAAANWSDYESIIQAIPNS